MSPSGACLAPKRCPHHNGPHRRKGAPGSASRSKSRASLIRESVCLEIMLARFMRICQLSGQKSGVVREGGRPCSRKGFRNLGILRPGRRCHHYDASSLCTKLAYNGFRFRFRRLCPAVIARGRQRTDACAGARGTASAPDSASTRSV